MLTDDDLTRELSTAFRAGTEHLRYAGRRRPRVTATVLVPALAVAASVATLGVAAVHDSGSPAGSSTASGTPAAPGSAGHGGTVTERLSLAGFTMAYQRSSAGSAPVYATREPGPVPDGFTPVANPANDLAKAWVGQDPRTGESTLYVQVPTRNGGQMFALHSPSWTPEQLVDLYLHGSQGPVPIVED